MDGLGLSRSCTFSRGVTALGLVMSPLLGDALRTNPLIDGDSGGEGKNCVALVLDSSSDSSCHTFATCCVDLSFAALVARLEDCVLLSTLLGGTSSALK